MTDNEEFIKRLKAPFLPPGFFIPRIENIHSKVYEAASQPGALDMLLWHSCETTHCRAGWVVHLAGKAGYALELACSWTTPSPTSLAARLIYAASGYHEGGLGSTNLVPNEFLASNDEALDDMRRLADMEAAQAKEAI